MDVGDVSGVTAAGVRRAPLAGDAATLIERPVGAYRAGIVGAGFMGRVHAHAIRVNGGEVVGVVGSNPASTARAATALRPRRVVADVEALLADPDVEVVHVCTPNHLHHPVASAALRAGKHVVCEKPLATTVADASELVALAAETGLVATVPFVYRFHPMVREARERVRSGGIGAVTLAHGAYLQDWLLQPTDDNWRVDPVKGGALRAFGDIGVHWCDLLEFTIGDRITEVSTQLRTTVAARGVASTPVTTEDVVTLSFATSGGVVGVAIISQVAPGRKNRLVLEVSGTHSSFQFDQEQPEQLWMGAHEANSILLRDPITASPGAARYSRLPAGHAQGYQDCFDSFVADTGAAIAGDQVDGLPTFADGLRSARLADAVLRSAATRSWVEVEP